MYLNETLSARTIALTEIKRTIFAVNRAVPAPELIDLRASDFSTAINPVVHPELALSLIRCHLLEGWRRVVRHDGIRLVNNNIAGRVEKY